MSDRPLPAPLLDVCDIDAYEITLRLTTRVRFPFVHASSLHGLVLAALGQHTLPTGVIPFTAELGRVQFERGDEYRLGVTFVGTARALAPAFLEGLATIGSRPQGEAERSLKLAGNFRVVSSEVRPLPSIDSVVETLPAGRVDVTLQWLSPLRLERPPGLQQPGMRHVNRECFPVDHFLLRLWQRLFYLVCGRYPVAKDHDACPFLPEDSRSRSDELLWVDAPATSTVRDGPRHAKRYTVGGVLGRVTLKDVPREWLPSLVIGQYVHMGSSTAYGLGRYRIVCDSPASLVFRPAETLLQHIADAAVLSRALEHVAKQSEAAGVDEETPQDLRDRGEPVMEELAAELRNAQYRPKPLRGFVAEKSGGGLRALTVPTARDRVVMRAVCTALQPSIDSLLEDCSYAYRKGFSRAGAARAIMKAFADGYRHVLDADIEAFFDSVEWPLLMAKLDALFPADPITGLIRAWVTAPVVFDRRLIRRRRGLPQGLSVSPMLANLFLDEFDEDLLGKDYRLVRYADDFVVLCKDVQHAEAARRDVVESLEAMALDLHEGKTSIRTFDEGFSYLGYLFRAGEDTTADSLGKIAGTSPGPGVARRSWLAQVPMARLRRLVLRRAKRGEKSRRVEVVPLDDVAEGMAKQTLHIFDPTVNIRLQGETLRLDGATAAPKTVPVRQLAHVVVYGKARMSLPAVLTLSRFDVPVFFCRRSGDLYATFSAREPEWALWQAQARCMTDPQMRLQVARAIVVAKVHNVATLVRKLDLPAAAPAAERMLAYARDAESAQTIEAVLGYEGSAAATYFGLLAEVLDANWGFQGRRMHPPPDPVNAMLSFGYAMLHQHVSTAVIAAGLHPRLGLMHRQHGAHHALASDLEEEFRYLVDGHVLAMARRGEVTLRDFEFQHNSPGRCYLSPELRRRFVKQLEDRLFDQAPDKATPVSYRELMDEQAAKLRDVILGRRGTYTPWRAHA